MKKYQRILLGIELNPATDKNLIAQALGVAKLFGAKLELVHSIEHFAGYNVAYGINVGVELETILLERAREEMRKVAREHSIDEKDCILKIGFAKEVILEEAEKSKVDLIIVGSHGRSGLRMLLGSTANAVLHNAKCDVLAVRLKP